MENPLSRTQMLFGKAAIETLRQSRVAVFGIGGVGGYVVEVLARSGIGVLDLIDNDTVCLSNLNRQIIALHSTIGKLKVDVAADRIHDINPKCIVHKHPIFYLPQNANDIDISKMDYVVDCIDTVTAKAELAKRCYENGIPILSCMGAANKVDAAAFRVADIYKTQMDPLAKALRKKLRSMGIPSLKVVYSEETPLPPINHDSEEEEPPKPHGIPASNAFVPAVAGMIAGGEVVKDLLVRAGTMRTT